MQFLTVARLVRTHGTRGELAAELETEDLSLFDPGVELELWDGDRARRSVRIRETRAHGDRLLIQFEGIDNLSQAELLAGWSVQIPATARPPAAPGSYYVADLVGCQMVDADSGRVVGKVQGWMETGAVPVLEVQDGKREILVPFAASICVEIDPANRTIRVRLPEGLESLP